MKCRICDSSRLDMVVDLGIQPWANHFLRVEEVGHEPAYPLRLVYCHDCAAAQLDYTVPKETMFGDHTYLSGVTRSLSDHFRSVALEVDQRVGLGMPAKSVLDIGSNDGTQLRHFQDLGWEVLGVESSKTIAKTANAAGVPTLNSFFNLEVARQMGRTFHAVHAAGVFFHLEELHSVAEGIRHCLRKDGVFIVQFLYMKRIVENLAFDQIYHEHLLYYNLQTIQRLLLRHGLALFDAYVSPIHGGSIIGFATHQNAYPRTQRLERFFDEEETSRCNEFATYQAFSRNIQLKRSQILAWMELQQSRRHTVFGMGAPVKGNTLLNYCGIGTKYIKCLVEKNVLRKDLYSPGMHIPIVLEQDVMHQPDAYCVLAWNFKKEILANHRSLQDAGIEFYFPIEPKED